MAGKGSKRRKENTRLINENWDKVFKKKKKSRLGKFYAKLFKMLVKD